MTIDNVWAELEQELDWRQEELRLLSNSRNTLRREAERERFRRAQLVMLYAHAEGFCKVALLIYVKAINDRKIRRSLVCDALVVASLDDLFHALQFGDKKGRVFSTPPPLDEKLLVFTRRCEFVRELESMMDVPLSVPDAAVNTESNLKGSVLRANLARLGFAVDLLEKHEGDLDELANRRHNIAHGIDESIVRATDYERMQRAVFEAMDLIVLSIVDALERESYLRPISLREQMPTLTVGEMR
jgi:hypothetical protein